MLCCDPQDSERGPVVGEFTKLAFCVEHRQQHERSDHDADFHQCECPELGARDAHKQERRAPQEAQRDQVDEIAGSHDSIRISMAQDTASFGTNLVLTEGAQTGLIARPTCMGPLRGRPKQRPGSSVGRAAD